MKVLGTTAELVDQHKIFSAKEISIILQKRALDSGPLKKWDTVFWR